MLAWYNLLQNEIQETSIQKYKFSSIHESPFIMSLFQILTLYRLAMHIATLIILVVHHGAITNVIASANNMITPGEQIELAKFSFISFIIVTFTSCLSFAMVASATEARSLTIKIITVLSCISEFALRLELEAPLMYICYLGSALGRHVERFSQVYIDTMFDQFMKASDQDSGGDFAGLQMTSSRFKLNSPTMPPIAKSLSVWTKFTEIFRALGRTSYLELPEMKMTKLSTTDQIMLTSSIRESNGRLTRLRLRKTQVMLCELRDMVGDINKICSPIIMLQVLYQTALIVLVTTSSIHLKIYKSFNLLIIPTVSSVVGLLILVAHVCTSLDDTTRQLKLMINKIFDFIIMNHGIKETARDSYIFRDTANVATDEDSLSETWSQFQYTRKLANTIQFTMSGVLPVTRRLIISIFGHVLSAVFISMEIMSIVDTSQDHSNNHRIGKELDILVRR